MRTGLVITYDSSGKPTLETCDVFTNAYRRFAAVKAGDWPTGAVKAELWDSEAGRGIPAVNINPHSILKKTMKKIIPIIAILFGLFTQANAQLQTAFSNYAIYQATDSNLATTVFIDCRGQKDISLEWTVKHSGTATAVEGIVFRPAMDGVNVPTEGPHYNFIITPTSGTTKRAITNFTVNGYPYLAITYITNIDADTYSTNTLKYWLKKNAP